MRTSGTTKRRAGVNLLAPGPAVNQVVLAWRDGRRGPGHPAGRWRSRAGPSSPRAGAPGEGHAVEPPRAPRWLGTGHAGMAEVSSGPRRGPALDLLDAHSVEPQQPGQARPPPGARRSPRS